MLGMASRKHMMQPWSRTCLLTCVLSVILHTGGTPADCLETVIIDSVEYRLPDHWRSHAVDSADIAKPNELVRLPQELTFDDYRIYVLPQTKAALVNMAKEAKKAGIKLIVDSGFRSVPFQKQIIRRRLARGDDFEKIITSVAPPGYSEHHTGRAVDFCPSEAVFASTIAYRWLKQNAVGFGFIETHPEDSTSTGSWESWHWHFSGDH